MLYGVRYERRFSSRKEELAFQRETAEKLLDWALKREWGLELSALSRERTPEGRPYFSDCPVHFSVSHCKGLVCCGLSDAPLGVDGESRRPFRQPLVERVCTEEERSWIFRQRDREEAFLQLWTLKESVMKLSGKGIAYGFQQARFTFEDGCPRFRDAGVVLSQFRLPGGWVVSAASAQEKFPEFQLVELP